MSKGWDNATLKKLKTLMGRGLSTSEIGKRLGLSKNAVVGKLNRMGWNLKAGGAPAEKEAPAPKAKATKKVAVANVAVPEKPAARRGRPPKPASEKVVKVPGRRGRPPKNPAEKAAAKKAAAAAKPVKEKKVAKVAAPVVVPKIVPNAKVSAKKNLAMHQRIIQHSLEMANLKPGQCRWPIGDPDSEHFHFCGEAVFVGKPYCYEHCKQAYQFTPPKRK